MKIFYNQAWNNFKKITLYECPFCGGEPELIHIGNNYKPKKKIIIKCKSCRIQRTDAALKHDFDWLENIATNNWNHRIWFKEK